MAVVARPPLYVPRPADERYWNGAPLASAAIVLTITQALLFGAHGQAQAKQWHYDYVPEPVWQGQPTANVSAIQTVFFMHGQPAQLDWAPYYNLAPQPETFWSWNGQVGPAQVLFIPPGGQPRISLQWPGFSYDLSPGLWSWTDSNGSAPILELLTLQTVFAAPGQVPTKQWEYHYESTTALWSFNYARNIILDQPNTPTVPVQWPGFSYDLSPQLWSWVPPGKTIATVTTFTTFYGAPGQVVTPAWSLYYNYSQPETFWSWAGAIHPAAILFTPPGGQPFNPRFWAASYVYQEPPAWQWVDQSSDTLTPLLTNLGIIKPPLWRYDYDLTPSIWYWRTPPDRLAFLPATVTFYGAIGQVPTKLWRYDYDTTVANWQYAPTKGYNLIIPGFVPPLQITDTNRIQLPVNAVMDYLQPRQGEPAGIPDEILKKIFGE